MKTELERRIREAYQYADALKNQMTTYDDPKWIKFILSSSCLNSVTRNIRTYLTATQTHEKRSSHTHGIGKNACLNPSHCSIIANSRTWNFGFRSFIHLWT